MVNIDCLFLGFIRFFVKEEDMAGVADCLLKNGISAKISEDGSFVLPLRRKRAAMRALENFSEVTVSEPLGIPGFFFRYRHRYGVFAALLVLLVFACFAGERVWDVRVEGDSTISAAYVTEALGEAGLMPGARFRDLDLSSVETDVLNTSERIAWLNINRRGTVAYVRVAAKAEVPDETPKRGYANIVADEDAMIEEITVRLGTEAVRVGDSVKRGDLLISGIGGGILPAEGSVRGRVRRTLEVTVPRSESITSYGERETRAVSVNFFGISLNIFKIYGNVDTDCAIIEETERLTLFGQRRLPVVLTRTVAVGRETTYRTYTDDECVKIAASRLASVLRSELSDGDLVRLRTGGAFTKEGYRMYAEVTEVREIGRRAEFEVKE